MTGPTAAPFAIAAVAFILLALWIALVFWADDHPAHKGHGAMPNPYAPDAREDTAADGEIRAREDAAAHREHEGGAQEPSRPGRRAA